MNCIICNSQLTPTEIYYYDNKCEDCERDELTRYQKWLSGANDFELDMLYDIPQTI